MKRDNAQSCLQEHFLQGAHVNSISVSLAGTHCDHIYIQGSLGNVVPTEWPGIQVKVLIQNESWESPGSLCHCLLQDIIFFPLLLNYLPFSAHIEQLTRLMWHRPLRGGKSIDYTPKRQGLNQIISENINLLGNVKKREVLAYMDSIIEKY